MWALQRLRPTAPTATQLVGPGFPAAQRPPAPRHFASFGRRSWFVPPIFIAGAEAISVGDGVVVLEGSSLEVSPGGRLSIGSGSRFLRFTSIVCRTEVSIGRDVLTSDYVTLSDSYDGSGRESNPRRLPALPIAVGDGAYLGAHSVIGPGVRVGSGAFVGEGAVVLEDVPPHSVVYGNPARVIGTLEGELRAAGSSEAAV